MIYRKMRSFQDGWLFPELVLLWELIFSLVRDPQREVLLLTEF
jgi:hypothetical protein